MSKEQKQVGLKSAAGLAAVLLVVAVGAPASASVVFFDNPAGAGHYDWAPPPDDFTHWLDITLPASAQPGVYQEGSFLQTNFDIFGQIEGGGSTSEVQAGGASEVLVWASAFGDPIPAEEPLPPNFNWNGSSLISHPSLGTNFLEGEEAYIGVRFDLGGGLQHGWIGVVRTGIALDAFAWGYETEVGVAIPAGIPEPGSLALLALGAGAALRRRRLEAWGLRLERKVGGTVR